MIVNKGIFYHTFVLYLNGKAFYAFPIRSTISGKISNQNIRIKFQRIKRVYLLSVLFSCEKDEKILHFEFQSKNEGLAGLKRFRVYEAVTSRKYKKEVVTYVLYSGKKNC